MIPLLNHWIDNVCTLPVMTTRMVSEPRPDTANGNSLQGNPVKKPNHQETNPRSNILKRTAKYNSSSNANNTVMTSLALNKTTISPSTNITTIHDNSKNITTFTSTIVLSGSACALRVFSKGIGIFILILGTWLKVPQLLSVMHSFSLSGLPVMPLFMETVGFMILVAYNIRQENPFSTWGESVSMLIADLMMLGIGYLAIPTRQFRKRLFLGCVAVCMLTFLRYLLFYASLNFLNGCLLGTAPLFLGSSLWQIILNQKNRHIGSLSPSMLWSGLICSWGRLWTSFIELDDPIILVSSVAGTFFATAMVLQMIAFRRGTRRYLQSLKKEL